MKRLDYIDGLKGWCAMYVCAAHFLLMFAINGYIGWKCLPQAAEQPVAYYMEWLPYSVFMNTSFPLYLFFAIISFVIAYFFLKDPDENKLKQKMILRYFRLLPVVLVSCLVAYLLLAFDLCKLQEFYDITGNTWGYARLEGSYSFWDALKIGLVTGYFEGTQLVSPFWCLHYIFLGSMMTFLVMLLYNRLNSKIAFFSFLILMLWFVDRMYLSFVAGILAAVAANREQALKKKDGRLLVLGGCLLGMVPNMVLFGFVDSALIYTVCAGMVLVGAHGCFAQSRLLCSRFMVFCGKESLAVIVWQFLLLQSLNIYLYNRFYWAGMGNFWNVVINFLVNAVGSGLLVWVSSKTITPLTNYTGQKAKALLWKQ